MLAHASQWLMMMKTGWPLSKCPFAVPDEESRVVVLLLWFLQTCSRTHSWEWVETSDTFWHHIWGDEPLLVGGLEHFFSPPARWGLLDFIRVVLLPPPPSSSVSSSASSSSSATSASTSTSTVALPTLGQALRQLRSSVRTAGPQPGTFPAQCAPLDLNLGPS